MGISHSVHSICVPTFPSRDTRPLQEALPLDCTILPTLKAPNPYRRLRCKKAAKRSTPALTTSPLTGIQKRRAVGKNRENLSHQTGSLETAGNQAVMLVAQGGLKATENTAVPITNFTPIVRATALMCHKEDGRDERHGHYVMSLG